MDRNALAHIKATNAHQRKYRAYILSACDTNEACAYVENTTAHDTIDTLVGEVERLTAELEEDAGAEHWWRDLKEKGHTL